MPSSDLTRRAFLQTTTRTAATAAIAISLHRLAYAAAGQQAWIRLFDGKTLKGWHKNPNKIGHGTGGQWHAEDGAIVGQQDPPGSGNGGILLTDQSFSDFELLIDMKPDWGVCSGLFLRGNDQGQCIQMMVDYHDAGNVGHLYGEGTGAFSTRTFDINGKYDAAKKLIGLQTDNSQSAQDVGLEYSCSGQQWLDAWKLNDWNTARVLVVGKYPHITTWINEVKVCEFDGSRSTSARYDKEKIFKTLGRAGSIAVQVHGGKGWPKGAKCRWKEIKIRPLRNA